MCVSVCELVPTRLQSGELLYGSLVAVPLTSVCLSLSNTRASQLFLAQQSHHRVGWGVERAEVSLQSSSAGQLLCVTLEGDNVR